MSTRRDSTTDRRQKNQYSLAFPEENKGAASTAFEGGTESELAKRSAESPTTEQWMEEVCERSPYADLYAHLVSFQHSRYTLPGRASL